MISKPTKHSDLRTASLDPSKKDSRPKASTPQKRESFLRPIPRDEQGPNGDPTGFEGVFKDVPPQSSETTQPDHDFRRDLAQSSPQIPESIVAVARQQAERVTEEEVDEAIKRNLSNGPAKPADPNQPKKIRDTHFGLPTVSKNPNPPKPEDQEEPTSQQPTLPQKVEGILSQTEAETILREEETEPPIKTDDIDELPIPAPSYPGDQFASDLTRDLIEFAEGEFPENPQNAPSAPVSRPIPKHEEHDFASSLASDLEDELPSDTSFLDLEGEGEGEDNDKTEADPPDPLMTDSMVGIMVDNLGPLFEAPDEPPPTPMQQATTPRPGPAPANPKTAPTTQDTAASTPVNPRDRSRQFSTTIDLDGFRDYQLKQQKGSRNALVRYVGPNQRRRKRDLLKPVGNMLKRAAQALLNFDFRRRR